MATRKKDNIRFFTAEQARKLILESESQSSESDGEDSFSDDSQTKCTVVRGKVPIMTAVVKKILPKTTLVTRSSCNGPMMDPRKIQMMT